MKRFLVNTHGLTSMLFLLLSTLVMPALKAQNYWDRIPALTSQCYDENDDFVKKIQSLRREIKEMVDKSKQTAEEKVSKMSQEEKMAFAMRYQNMQPDEIIRMQQEMAETTQIQTEFQLKSSTFETRFNELEADFRSDFQSKLGPIEKEYLKLPDGEGTPQWAIDKGEELMLQYNQEYESLCTKYFTSADAKFRVWLKDFNKFLLEEEIPFNDRMMEIQYAQFGLTPDGSVSTLMAVDRYLEKCSMIFNLRRPYPQG